MGQQYIESIDMYGKPSNREYPSELGAYIRDIKEPWVRNVLHMIFNEQYGVYYYEPCSVEEANKMIEKFEEKIEELKEKWC